MSWKFLSTILLAFAVLISASQATAQETVEDNIVRIKIGTSHGSGAYLGDRLVLSCAHLYNGENTLETAVWFKDGTKYVGKAVAIDTEWDQSLIELNTAPNRVGLPFTDKDPQPGEMVHAYGYGGTDHITVTSGYVIQYLANQENGPTDWFEINGQVDEGTSGGPIIDSKGYLIGNLWGSGNDGRTVGLMSCRTSSFLTPWRSRTRRAYVGGKQYNPGRQAPIRRAQYQPQPQQQSNLIPRPQAPSTNLAPLPLPVLPMPDQNTMMPSTSAPPSGPIAGACCPPTGGAPVCNINVNVDYQKVIDLLKQDEEFMAQAKGEPGQDGAPGVDGLPGVPGADGIQGQDGAQGPQGEQGEVAEITVEQLATMTAAIIQNLKADAEFIDATTGPQGTDGVDGTPGAPGQDGADGQDGTDGEVIEPIPDSTTEWTHLVLIAPTESEYWYRLESEYTRAATHYNMIRHVEPPTDRNIGPMPVLVAYSGGKPAKSWIGLRDVSQALTKIVRGEYDEFLLATND